MTTASRDTSTTMQPTKAEDAKPAINAPKMEGITGETSSGGQRKGKQKKNKNKKNKDNKAAGKIVADLATKADGTHTTQTSSKDALGEDAKLFGQESLGLICSGSMPTGELETKEDSGKKEDSEGHMRTRSVTVKDAPETPPAQEEVPVHKSAVKHEETKPVLTGASTFDASTPAEAEEAPSPTETHETPTQPTVSPSTISSEPVPITPTSLATESPLIFSPAAIFPHAFQEEKLPKHVFHEPNMMNPIPNPIHPHQPERSTAEDLIHTVTAHHHQALHPQPNRLQSEPILIQDAPIPPPPKPKSPASPLHVPGPGVTAGRIVMLADPPPPIGCLAPTRERRLTEYNIGHIHAGHIHSGHGFPGDNPYPAHRLSVSSTEARPTGYTQNPRAAEWQGTTLGRGPYDSGLGERNDEDEDGKGEGGGLFGRRTPTGATVSTKGYHRRGEEDVGLVASLVNLWEKSRNWFQEWVQATRW